MSKSKIIPFVLILGVVGLVAYFNNSPGRSTATTSVLSDYVLYGINSTSGELQRYAFASGTLQAVGTVADSGGSAMTGIRASAYIPGFVNIYGFWQDPADGLSKLVYINATDAAASVVGADLGPDPITGATAVVDGTRYRVYALQSPDLVDFAIGAGSINPSETYAANITVLGAAISAGGSYDMPVTVTVHIGGTDHTPFGDAALPLDANVNDSANPRHYAPSSTFSAAAPISITGTSWEKMTGEDGDQNSEWEQSMTVSSNSGSAQVLTLRNGDAVPNIAGFLDQASLAEFINDYVDATNNVVTLGHNQVIYLFELGTTDLTSSSADFQDLVVLVTLGSNVDDIQNNTVSDVSISGNMNINPNNSPRNEFTLVKDDGSAITRDNLNQDTVVDENAVYYSGPVTSIYLKPKGNGSQNTLMVDGTPYETLNQTAYTITGTGLTATVYNDNINSSGKAMGKWWVSISSDTPTGVVIEDDYTPPAGRLVEVNHQTGETIHVMDLERSYVSLASGDGVNFYAFSGTDLYSINTSAGTETLIGTVAASDVEALEYAGSDLYGFDIVTDQLAPIDPDGTPLVGSAVPVGTMQDLGTVIIAPLLYDPALYKAQYD